MSFASSTIGHRERIALPKSLRARLLMDRGVVHVGHAERLGDTLRARRVHLLEQQEIGSS